jgi:hypothetical protein
VTPEPAPRPPFDRERFVFQTLAVVIGTQLLIYSLAAGVCGQRALEGRPVGQICPGTLEQLQGGFDSTLNLLLALLGLLWDRSRRCAAPGADCHGYPLP